ncbi:MAG: AAA family ATPase [Firmicutes bacterium]|nr:AAA family ATPase [Bacillota bacterium]
MITELDYKSVSKFYTVEDIAKQSENIDPLNTPVGQATAADALKFGLSVKKPGYNIYVTGPAGSGKTTFAELFAKNVAKKEKTPDDLCYVCNFENPTVPKLLSLSPGMGKEFKEDMDEISDRLRIEIPAALNDMSFTEEKERIFKFAQEEKDKILKDLTEQAKQAGFGVKTANSGGVYFLPIVDGKTISEEEFDALSDEEKEKITDDTEEIQELASKAMASFRAIDKNTKENIERAEYNTSLITVGHFMDPIQSKYAENKQVSDFLKLVKEDILENVSYINSPDDEGGDDPMSNIAPWFMRKNPEDIFLKYKVNLIVDNSETEGAPVIVNFNPSYTNLVGEVEYESENGNFTTDFMKIKPGLFHKANGGYLIFHASDILGNAFTWDTLKRMLKTGQVVTEPLREYQLGGISVATIQPEPLDVNIKVIIVGTHYYYDILNQYDDDFRKMFRITALFDYEMPANEENLSLICGFIKNYIKEKDFLPITDEACAYLLSFMTRLAEQQDKFSTRFGALRDIIVEANTWALVENSPKIEVSFVKKAIAKKKERTSLYSEKYMDMILRGDVLISTEGKNVGQINGLCVLESDDFVFGMPTRITASTYTGKSGVVNIEKEAEMSGNIHDKGMQVLIGYLGQKYATDFPLTFSSRLCFEQSYNGVDGDSASSTEVYALLSSLSSLGVDQSLAVTGSMDQFGRIQAIGGVTHKIEGFYHICRSRGLTGKQGVIIPRTNVKDLVLNEEVTESIKKGDFHIYAIDSIDDGLELLLGRKAGQKLKTKGYTKDSVHALVYKKLENYYKKSKED